MSTKSIRVGDENIEPSNAVRNIGAYFDSEMRMCPQVNNVCKKAWLNLYNIGKVSGYLTEEQKKTVVHAYVTSKLDGQNALLAGAPLMLTSQLQRVQNASAKLIKKARKYDHVSPLLADLHWLPVNHRITYKVLLLTFKALNNKGPSYLKDLFTFYHPSRNLRSSMDDLTLNTPKTRLITFGDRSFSAVAVTEWNKLPLQIRSTDTVSAFKSKLKTYFFQLLA